MIIILFVILAFVSFYLIQKSGRRIVDQSCVFNVKAIDSSFNWESQQPLKIRPFVNKTNFNPSIGLKSLTTSPEDWLLIENTYLKNITTRKASIEAEPEKVLYINKDSTTALKETFEIVSHFLLSRYPDYFKLKNKKVHNLITNDTYSIDELDETEIIKILGRTIEEDFLILSKDGDVEYKLKCSLTGFPAGFDPSVNFNQSISFIHKPVPQYDKLKFSMNKFFNNLKCKDLWVRFNWSIQTHSDLFNLNNHGRPGEVIKKKEILNFKDGCFLRNERQCFLRLPKTNAILMTIRTYLTSMEKIKNEEQLGEQLSYAIDHLPDDLAYYKKRHEWGDSVKEYLLKS